MTAFTLKLIALLSMTLDHIGLVLFPDAIWLRVVGRLALPIFAFQLTEGHHHTHSKQGYALRLFVLALISEVPFDLMVSGVTVSLSHQNALWSLLLGFFMLSLAERAQQVQTSPLVRRTTLFCIVFLAAVLAESLSLDYGGFGIFQIYAFYILRHKGPFIQSVCICLINLLLDGSFAQHSGLLLPLQSFAVFAMIPIACYNEQKGPNSLLWHHFYYLFFPLHMIILVLLQRLLT